MSMKNPLTLVAIEPATFRFVAQHCATAVPILSVWLVKSSVSRCQTLHTCLLLAAAGRDVFAFEVPSAL